MFLYLSKLIPLFLYPLGLACLLLFIALVLAWKFPRRLPIPVGLALIILLLSSNGWVSNEIVRSLEWQHLPPQEIPQADAIVILGGSTRPQSPPRATVEIAEQGDRVIYGGYLYQQKKAPLIIPAGGRISWKGGGDKSEAEDMAALLKLMGIPSQDMILEKESLNTYENAVNVKKILQQKKLNKILLVTSALHMPRALKIFQKRNIEAIPAPTDFLVSEQLLKEPSSSTEAIFLNLIPDVDHLEYTTKAIKEYIGTIVYRLKGWL
ncbi:MAG: YdcF family protein [Spirulinaceae cyanobacterium]